MGFLFLMPQNALVFGAIRREPIVDEKDRVVRRCARN